MKQLRDAFNHVFKELCDHGFMPYDEQMREAMWVQFISDLSRNLFPSKATQ